MISLTRLKPWSLLWFKIMVNIIISPLNNQEHYLLKTQNKEICTYLREPENFSSQLHCEKIQQIMDQVTFKMPHKSLELNSSSNICLTFKICNWIRLLSHHSSPHDMFSSHYVLILCFNCCPQQIQEKDLV